MMNKKSTSANSDTKMTDVISSLPEKILRQILCLIPTKYAIRTSVLSKRWRHVWCKIPSLSFEADTFKADSINETLTRYTAPKLKDFHLTMTQQNIPHVETWIEFAMSRDVENLSLEFRISCPVIDDTYKFPDFLYINSSVKQLRIKLSFSHTMLKNINCSVSWTSLQKLSLHCCGISDESIAKILSGCPVLETLTLCFCNKLKVLDLSKSLRLRSLQVNCSVWVEWPTQIVAPHIHYLRLTNSQFLCTLVDVASLTEAKLGSCFSFMQKFEADSLQDMVMKMLEKLQHVEKLTFDGNFLQILSLAEVCGVPFPMFKVKVLTLETAFYQYVIPGIERLLQNSPDLEKLTIHGRNFNTIQCLNTKDVECVDNYLNQKGLNPNQCWRSKDGVFWNKCRWDVELKHVVSFVELVLKNTKRLDKMVLLLKERYLKFKFEELLPTISQHNNVFIALSTNTSDEEEEW